MTNEDVAMNYDVPISLRKTLLFTVAMNREKLRPIRFGTLHVIRSDKHVLEELWPKAVYTGFFGVGMLKTSVKL